MNYELSRKGKFRPASDIGGQRKTSYNLLPFRFDRLSENRTIVTNDVGEFAIVGDNTVQNLINGEHVNSADYNKLESIHVVSTGEDSAAYSLLPLKIRRKYEHLKEFTSLHMMVVTLRCNQSCPYCQVSRQSEDRQSFDMSWEHARAALEHIYKTPASRVKIEFQGGESLLNFELIKKIVVEVNDNGPKDKVFDFVAATNLTILTDEIIDFFGKHNIVFSTSIDGPKDLHDANRPYKGKDAFDIVCHNIKRIQDELGKDKVSALMTTTSRSLSRVKEIVDQYIELGFRGIFFRSLSPYGFALKTKTYYEYSAKEWLDFYKEGLDYILEINRSGFRFEDFYTRILAERMLKNRPTGFVNLQSPTGEGIMGVIYDYNGNVYSSDEGRMLAQMNDEELLLGHVEDDYRDLFYGSRISNIVGNTMAEGAPMCSDCAFLPWCGSDPSYHQSTQKDILGHKAYSGFCHKQTGAFKHLIKLFDERPEDRKIIESWLD